MAADLRKRPPLVFDGVRRGRIYSSGSMAGTGDPTNPWSGWSTGFAISVYLLSAVLVWGGIGYLADRLAGTPNVFAVLGMIVGAATGIYLVYLRYGRDHHDTR